MDKYNKICMVENYKMLLGEIKEDLKWAHVNELEDSELFNYHFSKIGQCQMKFQYSFFEKMI